MSRKGTIPGRFSRGCAWAAAVILTAMLTAALLGVTAVHALTSEELHIQAATGDENVAEQMHRISEYIRELAKDYDFSADEAIQAVSPDDLRDMNRDMAVWWTRMLNDGVLDRMPVWSSGEVRDAIRRTMNGESIPEDRNRDELTAEVYQLLVKRIGKVTMPVRKALIQKGFQILRRRINPGEAVRFLSQATVLAGAVSLLLAGIILGLLGRKIRFSLRYFGAVLAGAGLSCLAGGLIIRSAGIQHMIREVSEGLDIQVRYILRTVTMEAAAGTAVLLAAGIACLILDVRKPALRPGDA